MQKHILLIPLLAMATFCWAASTPAQRASPSRGTQAATRQDDFQDDIPLDVYLNALTQISPAAREGADAYIQAFKRRCGRALTPVELRRAIAIGNGDSVLMAMMGAASQHDTATLQRLSGKVSCSRGK